MKILITGGAGYIGSTLAQLLLTNRHEVRVLDYLAYGGQSLLGVLTHPGFEFIRGDLRDVKAVRDALKGMDAVVHLAAIVGDPACANQPDTAREINLDASLQLIKESKKSGISRFVFASTCSNYGKMKNGEKYVDENSELRPVSLYAESKVAVEREILNPMQTGEMCSTSLRFATVFGVSPRMRFDLTVNEFTMKILTEKYLTVYGEQFWRPYIHVRDAAHAIQTVLKASRKEVQNQTFNVGSTDQNFQKQQLISLIKPHAPDAKIEYVHKDEDPRDYRVSFARIQNILKYKITRTVKDGINEVAQLVRGGVITDFDNPIYRNLQ